MTEFLELGDAIARNLGAIKLLSSECARIGINRPLIVTDAGVRAAGILQRALDALGDAVDRDLRIIEAVD